MGAEQSRSKNRSKKMKDYKVKEYAMNATQFSDSDSSEYDVGDVIDDIRGKATKFGKKVKQYDTQDLQWLVKDGFEEAKYHTKNYAKNTKKCAKNAKKCFKTNCTKKPKDHEDEVEAEEKHEEEEEHYANSPVAGLTSPVLSGNYGAIVIHDNAENTSSNSRRGKHTQGKGKGVKYSSTSSSSDSTTYSFEEGGPSRNRAWSSSNSSGSTSFHSFPPEDDESSYQPPTNNGSDGYGYGSTASPYNYHYGHNSSHGGASYGDYGGGGGAPQTLESAHELANEFARLFFSNSNDKFFF